MKKTTNHTEALVLLRQQFFAMNKKLADKLEKWEKTGTITISLGNYDFDYIKFIEVRKSGFLTGSMIELFEILMYIHFFDHLCRLEMDLRNYIKFDIFNETEFMTDAKDNSKFIIAMNVVKKYASDLLKGMGIAKPKELFEDADIVLSQLNTVKYAADKELHYYGEHEFLISKLPIDDECIMEDIHLVNQVFYTYKPEHIITMAQVSKPGIYIIANVPYGRHAETAFYILHRFTKGAYLIENCKHSFRRQHYRTKSDGTDGRDAWLGNRYEYSYFPVNLVLEYFEKTSKDKDIAIPDKDHSFRSLGKITDAEAEVVLWLHSFTAKCLQILSEKKFIKDISTAMSVEFIQPKLKGTSSNVPAIYKNHVPSLSDIDLTWSAKTTEVEASMNNACLEPHIKSTELDLQQVPTGRLVPQAHLERELMFNKRLQDVERLQKDLDKDFLANWENVFSSIGSFVRQYGFEKAIQRALENGRYPLRMYQQFAQKNKYIKRGKKYGTAQAKILYCIDVKSKNEQGSFKTIWSASDPHIQLHASPWGDFRRIFLDDGDRFIQKKPCSICDKYRGRYYHTVQFLDYLQFKTFFEISEEDEEQLPYQLKDFLNQERTLYYGNSILDDIDPLCLMTNPWWTQKITRGEIAGHGNRDHPAIFLAFNLCKRCRRKLI